MERCEQSIQDKIKLLSQVNRLGVHLLKNWDERTRGDRSTLGFHLQSIRHCMDSPKSLKPQKWQISAIPSSNTTYDPAIMQTWGSQTRLETAPAISLPTFPLLFSCCQINQPSDQGRPKHTQFPLTAVLLLHSHGMSCSAVSKDNNLQRRRPAWSTAAFLQHHLPEAFSAETMGCALLGTLLHCWEMSQLPREQPSPPPLAVLSSQPCSPNSHRQRCLAGGRQPGSLAPAVTGCLCPWQAGSASTSAAGTDVRVRKGTVFSNLGGRWEQWSIQLTQPDLEELIPLREHSHGCNVAVGKGWRAWVFAQTVHQKTQESPPDLTKATCTLNLYQPAVNCFWKHQEASFRISLCITNLRKL